jgi:hypothetical protein
MNMPDDGPQVDVFVDLSNDFVALQQEAAEREPWYLHRRARLHFGRLHELAAAGRHVRTVVVVGSTTGTDDLVWARWRRLGYRTVVLDRGADGREQGVDEALQDEISRVRLAGAPGVAVLLTGDDAGAEDGIGFVPVLRGVIDAGWAVELLSWRRATHHRLQQLAEEHGVYVPLDDFYDEITYLEDHAREAAPLRVRPRPLAQWPARGHVA